MGSSPYFSLIRSDQNLEYPPWTHGAICASCQNCGDFFLYGDGHSPYTMAIDHGTRLIGGFRFHSWHVCSTIFGIFWDNDLNCESTGSLGSLSRLISNPKRGNCFKHWVLGRLLTSPFRLRNYYELPGYNYNTWESLGVFTKKKHHRITLWWTNIAIENGHRHSGFSH